MMPGQLQSLEEGCGGNGLMSHLLNQVGEQTPQQLLVINDQYATHSKHLPNGGGQVDQAVRLVEYF